MSEISRRGILISGSAAALATLISFGPRPGSASAQGPAAADRESGEDLQVTLDIVSARREYEQAVQAWPFQLPPGYRLPPTSRLQDPPDGPALWDKGSGLSEAFFNWVVLTALAARAAARRGNVSQARLYLGYLVAAQGSDVQKAVIIDPENTFLIRLLRPATDELDFTSLSAAFRLDALNDRPELLSIARSLGDS